MKAGDTVWLWYPDGDHMQVVLIKRTDDDKWIVETRGGPQSMPIIAWRLMTDEQHAALALTV